MALLEAQKRAPEPKLRISVRAARRPPGLPYRPYMELQCMAGVHWASDVAAEGGGAPAASYGTCGEGPSIVPFTSGGIVAVDSPSCDVVLL